MSKHRIVIDFEVCKGCDLCVFYCPRDVLQLSDQINAKGYNVVEVVNLDNCTGCNLCMNGCPDFAIFVTKSTPNET